MDDNSSDNVSSGGGDNFVSPPLTDTQPVSDVPPAVVPPPPPVTEPSIPQIEEKQEESLPPPPPLPKEEPLKPNLAKSAVLAAVFLLIAVSSVAGYYLVRRGGLGWQKKAVGEACGGDCSVTTWGAAWSTCGNDGTRWGCDDHCNKWTASAGIGSGQYTDPWCEGTTKKECVSGGTVNEERDSLDCGGGPTGPCAGKQAKSYCEGVGDHNGSTTVLNCTGSRQQYQCQTNHTSFTDKTVCDATNETQNYTGESTLVVESGRTATCSVGAGGVCDIGQADIRDNGTMFSGVCWDTIKDCTCPVASPTPTSTVIPSLTPTLTLPPTQTPTPTQTLTPIPTDTPRPTATATPTTPPGVPTPTPQPTVAPACNFVKVYKVNADGTKTLLSNGALLNAGDRLYLEASFKLNTAVQKAVVAIRRNGVVVREKFAQFISDPPTDYDADYRITFYYDITATGNYEVGAFYYYGYYGGSWH